MSTTTTTTTTTTAVAAKKEVTMNTTSGAATNPGPPLSQYSQVDLALGDYIAEGGFSFIFELLSIRNLSSESENHHDSKVGQDEFILQPAVTPGSSLDKQPPKYFPPNIPRTKSEGSNHKKNHKRGGGNGFSSFAGFVSRTASSSKGHKRGASSPGKVLEILGTSRLGSSHHYWSGVFSWELSWKQNWIFRNKSIIDLDLAGPLDCVDNCSP